MKKTTKQKSVKKKIVTQKPKAYKLEMLFNGHKFKKATDNIDEAIQKLKPEILYTDVYITASKNKDVSERRLNLTQGKNLFINEDFRQVFINNLLLN